MKSSWTLKRFLSEAGEALSIRPKEAVFKSTGVLVRDIKAIQIGQDLVLLQEGEVYDPSIHFLFPSFLLIYHF